MDSGKTRSLSGRSRFKYVRRVRTPNGVGCWQARGWLPMPLGSINLGCYSHESAAWAAVKQWLRSGADPVKGLPDGILPKWVVARPDGRFDAVLRTGGGQRSVLPGGPWDTAEAAHLAAREAVEQRSELRKAEKRRAKAAAKQALMSALVEQLTQDEIEQKYRADRRRRRVTATAPAR